MTGSESHKSDRRREAPTWTFSKLGRRRSRHQSAGIHHLCSITPPVIEERRILKVLWRYSSVKTDESLIKHRRTKRVNAPERFLDTTSSDPKRSVVCSSTQGELKARARNEGFPFHQECDITVLLYRLVDWKQIEINPFKNHLVVVDL
jgi:hypothetical protein